MKETPYPAPDFSLIESVTGTTKNLKDYRGRWLILYFYPKDDTPGCTTEACSLRDARDLLTDIGAEVVGVSMDAPAHHEKFKSKHNLNFDLLSDPNKIAIEAYGAWGKKQFGKEGILRKTFIINPDGQVVKVYGRVTPEGHGDQIVEEVKKQQAKS